MDTEYLGKVVNSWSRIGENNQSVLLIGYTNSGKSTFAELINKYQHGVKSEGLIFEKDKYLYEGVISAKSIKIQTVVPTIYRSHNKDDTLAIIDVPCYSMPPQAKKWGPSEQKLIINMTLSRCNKVGILLFIEEKNTRSNPNNWKKTLGGFIDMFKDYPDDLLNSVGWVITKCPPDMTEDAVAKRIQQFQAAFKNDKNVDISTIDKLFENILSNNRFYLFKKTSGNQEQEGTEIRNIYKKLPLLCNYNNPSWVDYHQKSHIKDTPWTKDQQLLFKKYLEEQESRLEQILQLISQSLKELVKVLKMSPEEVKKFKKQYLQLDQGERNPTERILKLVSKNNENLILTSFINWFKDILQEVNSNQSKSVYISKYLQLLARFPLISEEDWIFFQNGQEALDFSEYVQIGTFQKSSDLLRKILTQEKNSFIETVSKLTEENENEVFYESIIELIQSDQELESNHSAFLKQCKDDIIKFKNPKTMIEKYLQILKNGPAEKQLEAILLVARTLQKQKYVKQSFYIYKLVNSPGDLVRCMQLFPPQTEAQALEYIDIYINIYLFETAKKACYEYSSTFGFKSRKTFGLKLKQVMSSEKKQSYNLLLEQQVLKARTLDQILLQVESILGKFPDN